MKRIRSMSVGVVAACMALAVFSAGLLLGEHHEEDPLAQGKVLQRAMLPGDAGMEAILVLRELPPGAESGRHTQSGTEVVYILEGSVVVEIDGREPMSVGAGEAFTTAAGEVHNVKNASADAPGKALAFYIAAEGAELGALSVPAE